jgi:hypothetical protein
MTVLAALHWPFVQVRKNMTRSFFEALALALGTIFAIAFFVIVIPPLAASSDIAGAFGAGFVNPFSTGYSVDAVLCGAILIVWIIYDKITLKINMAGSRFLWLLYPAWRPHLHCIWSCALAKWPMDSNPTRCPLSTHCGY